MYYGLIIYARAEKCIDLNVSNDIQMGKQSFIAVGEIE